MLKTIGKFAQRFRVEGKAQQAVRGKQTEINTSLSRPDYSCQFV